MAAQRAKRVYRSPYLANGLQLTIYPCSSVPNISLRSSSRRQQCQVSSINLRVVRTAP
jgi:hypothetical protein